MRKGCGRLTEACRRRLSSPSKAPPGGGASPCSHPHRLPPGGGASPLWPRWCLASPARRPAGVPCLSRRGGALLRPQPALASPAARRWRHTSPTAHRWRLVSPAAPRRPVRRCSPEPPLPPPGGGASHLPSRRRLTSPAARRPNNRRTAFPTKSSPFFQERGLKQNI